MTGIIHSRQINVDECRVAAWFDHWNSGEKNCPPIQDAFPDISAGNREFLLSGITPEEWALSIINFEREDRGWGPVKSLAEMPQSVLENFDLPDSPSKKIG